MPTISEQYRPKTLEAFLGNAKAIAAARFWATRGLGGQPYWISGATGTGKTTLARILARGFADVCDIVEYDSADQVAAAELDALGLTMLHRGLGPRGNRVFIINEAHGLRGPIMRRLLGLLERIPDHVAILCTTTRDGEGLLFDDIDGKPLIDRCKRIPLTSQGLNPLIAQRLIDVGAREGFTIPRTVATEVAKGGSFRAAIEWLGSPASMHYLKPAAGVTAA
jgi:hypothetical protein